MLRKLLLLHLLPFLLATLTVIGGVFFVEYFQKSKSQIVIVEKTIEGKQDSISGFYPNFQIGEKAELDLISSIKNKNQLTIFGSSEFRTSPYCAYNFLPDSLGLQAMGIGHAHHQEFSILCELLAANEHVGNSKICIVLSLGWFQAGGTNVSAFLEFVRPNFLAKILNDDNIESKYKIAIGRYIDEKYNDLTSVSNIMSRYRDIYLSSDLVGLDGLEYLLKQKIKNIYKVSDTIENVNYNITDLNYLTPKEWEWDMDKQLNLVQEDFVSKITNNDLFVYDDYYQKYLIDSDGNQKTGNIYDIDIFSNREFEDFNLLVNYLKSRNANCSFIIQPLNPYYYEDLEEDRSVLDAVTKVLDSNDIPYLNMYVFEKENYEPGTLKDIMHLGDYGWLKINYFLDSIYNDHEKTVF